jgi:uncharacterized protein
MSFSKKLGWVGLCFVFLSCGHVPENPGKVEPQKDKNSSLDYPKRIIDAHSHFMDEEEEGGVQPLAEMVAMFEKANVVGAVVHLPRNLERNRALKIDRNRTKIKMALCAAVVPGETVERVEKGLAAGEYQCLKVYLGYVPRYVTDPFYEKFYPLAEKYQVPVVFHTGDTYDKKAQVKYADPLQIDDVAVQFPKVKFVIAHMGNPWFHSAAEVVYKNDNVYVDISALILGDVSQATPESVEELIVKPLKWFWLYVENPKKMMFGSDWPLMEVKPYVLAVMKAIPKEHWDEVFYQNAAELFKLESNY